VSIRSDRCLLLFSVVFDPKIGKQDEKDGAVRRNDVLERQGVDAVRMEDDNVGHVSTHGHKLGHLEVCEMFLPPQVLVILGAHRGQAVVCIHHHVHKGVDERVERAQTTCGILDSPPPSVSHQCVVEYVQE